MLLLTKSVVVVGPDRFVTKHLCGLHLCGARQKCSCSRTTNGEHPGESGASLRGEGLSILMHHRSLFSSSSLFSSRLLLWFLAPIAVACSSIGGSGDASSDVPAGGGRTSSSGASTGQSGSGGQVFASGGMASGGSALDGAGGVPTESGGGGGGSAGAGGAPQTGGVGGSDGGSSGGANGTGGEPPSFETLREAAEAAGVFIGAAVNDPAFRDDGTFRDVLAREFDYVTHENVAKWGPLAPSSNSYDWGPVDAVIDFAEDSDQEVKFHTHIWHRQYPSWIDESMSPDQLRSAMKSHIEATMNRYQGRIRAWDVVNEAVDVESPSGYTESVFYDVLGPSYIEDAFRYAREADPDVELIYNEVGIERMGPKSDFTYTMIKDLLEKGVPIDGIGFQSHISTHRYPSESDLRENLRRFAELGLTVNISEVDARTKLLPGDQETRWHAQRIAFQQIVSACVAEPACEAVTFWGLMDGYSWINDEGEEDALLFDRDFMKKPAYQGVMAGLVGLAPVRGDNLLQNGDFSSGSDSWSAQGGTLSVGAASGRQENAGCVSGRGAANDGPIQEGLLDALAGGGPMALTAQVRVSAASPVDGLLVIQSGGGQEEFNVATREIEAETWTRLSGYLGLGFESTPTAVSLKVSGPDPGVELCVTDVKLQKLSVN